MSSLNSRKYFSVYIGKKIKYLVRHDTLPETDPCLVT